MRGWRCHEENDDEVNQADAKYHIKSGSVPRHRVMFQFHKFFVLHLHYLTSNNGLHSQTGQVKKWLRKEKQPD